MNEEVFNMELRKFLKRVGVTSQREIETAVRQALEAGKLDPKASLEAKVTLSLPALGVTEVIDGKIALS